jgi:hypothetical protein
MNQIGNKIFIRFIAPSEYLSPVEMLVLARSLFTSGLNDEQHQLVMKLHIGLKYLTNAPNEAVDFK